MRFSDIHMIMIGEEGEYGRRLVRYLETHLSTAIRVYHFTTTESFLAFKERADIYLLDEAFRGEAECFAKREAADLADCTRRGRHLLQVS